MALKEEEIRKNKYDLKYQHYISLRNILWAAAISVVLGVWNVLGNYSLQNYIRITLTSIPSTVLFLAGLVSWKKAQKTLERIGNLS